MSAAELDETLRQPSSRSSSIGSVSPGVDEEDDNAAQRNPVTYFERKLAAACFAEPTRDLSKALLTAEWARGAIDVNARPHAGLARREALKRGLHVFDRPAEPVRIESGAKRGQKRFSIFIPPTAAEVIERLDTTWPLNLQWLTPTQERAIRRSNSQATGLSMPSDGRSYEHIAPSAAAWPGIKETYALSNNQAASSLEDELETLATEQLRLKPAFSDLTDDDVLDSLETVSQSASETILRALTLTLDHLAFRRISLIENPPRNAYRSGRAKRVKMELLEDDSMHIAPPTGDDVPGMPLAYNPAHCLRNMASRTPSDWRDVLVAADAAQLPIAVLQRVESRLKALYGDWVLASS
ncbi:uncharacterized protein L969DRAFT_97422 [Mixia osmundae IAM 14324]|uniref:Uncharacterized protein n=1 Tax=Mixia osmundae (strain CBS 9802 / IAM 14324 / JCM 22182 / KY 12970) TaxID=764103 RepID=G7DUJ4_MIXOS|nr:uncharacterized protein L969DRAFT_97422 [Mixia osmundae IAM 14324]KEI36411.1 hypothetical protein L969DRAFT_97422 [Mixia osmundae IAM 14324]GAA94254.1 hypothetical protein E5Q_00903 [Mixia osmundae IAM 14324]